MSNLCHLLVKQQSGSFHYPESGTPPLELNFDSTSQYNVLHFGHLTVHSSISFSSNATNAQRKTNEQD